VETKMAFAFADQCNERIDEKYTRRMTKRKHEQK